MQNLLSPPFLGLRQEGSRFAVGRDSIGRKSVCWKLSDPLFDNGCEREVRLSVHGDKT